jgi:nucleotide-binding universal stress UspA family protein
MNNLKNILVALDLGPMDVQVMRFLEHFTQAVLPDSITFLHVAAPVSVPDTVFGSKADKDLYRQGRISEMKALLNDAVQEHFGHRSDMQVTTEVIEGQPLNELLKYVEAERPQLLVVGKKKHSSGSGIISQKLARRVPASMLLVPEDSAGEVKRILVPVDFSEYSVAAMGLAVELAPLLGDPEVTALNVFDLLPTVALKIGRTPEQMDRMIRANVDEALEEFLARVPHGKMNIIRKPIPNRHNSPAKHILEYMDANNVDLVIMGAKGHNLLESLFLGSVTERILMANQKVPMLVVRP